MTSTHGQRARRAVVLISVVALALSAVVSMVAAPAAGATEAGRFPITVENCGREVTIPEPPERVLAMGGEAGSLIWAAGAAGKISTYASFEGELLGPAEAALRAVPVVLPVDDLSQEVILGQEPDVVVTYGLDQTTPEALADAGIQTLIIYCSDDVDPFERIYANILLYGQLLGTQDQAAKTVADLRARVAAVEKRQVVPAGTTAATVFVPDEGALSGYGNGSTPQAQMSKLGLENVFAGVDEGYFELSVEKLIAADRTRRQRPGPDPQLLLGVPDVLIAQYGFGSSTADSARDRLRALSELGDVTAIRNDDIVPLVFDYSGGGYLAIEGLEVLADQLAALQR